MKNSKDKINIMQANTKTQPKRIRALSRNVTLWRNLIWHLILKIKLRYGNIFCNMEKGDEINIAFQGGEPTLAGLDFYQQFTQYVEEKKAEKGLIISYAFQTNGLIVDDSWCELFKKYNFLLGLSHDSIIPDDNRLDSKGKGTASRVMQTKALFDKHKVEYNILSVLTSELARHPEKTWNFIKRNNIRYIQFTPCLGDLSPTKPEHYRLTPERFASFYSKLILLWKADFDSGNYISVKLIDDLVHMYFMGQVNACGLSGNCSVQCVVEADGSVYPCDFYALDEYKIGSLEESTLEQLILSDTAKDFIKKKNYYPLCTSCPYVKVCGGGCKRMKNEIYLNQAGDFCGMRTLLNNCIGLLREVAVKVYR